MRPRTLLVVFVSLVIYVLSPIPVGFGVYSLLDQLPDEIYDKIEPVFSQTIEFVYYPLQWLYDNVPAVEAFYDWYGELFDY